MTHPIGYYTGYTPGRDEGTLLDRLQERYGSTLSGMSLTRKLIFRAVLCDFQVCRQAWTNIDAKKIIEACLDEYDFLWGLEEKDPEFYNFILECHTLRSGDIEGMIEALTAQIISGCYATPHEK